MGPTESTLSERRQRPQVFRERHARAEIAVSFTAGFLLDILTLSRIVDVATLVQGGCTWLLGLCSTS